MPPGPVTLDILVENTGRINYGPRLQDGQAGITRSVSRWGSRVVRLAGLFPSDERPGGIEGLADRFYRRAGFHRGTFSIASVADTYLDVSKLGKGFVWVNGHNLGRVWSIGSARVAVSACALVEEGLNQVVVFDFTDLEGPEFVGWGIRFGLSRGLRRGRVTRA